MKRILYLQIMLVLLWLNIRRHVKTLDSGGGGVGAGAGRGRKGTPASTRFRKDKMVAFGFFPVSRAGEGRGEVRGVGGGGGGYGGGGAETKRTMPHFGGLLKP